MSKISARHMTIRDKNEYILDQIAKLRIAVSDTDLTSEECHAIKASLQALFQNLDNKCGKSPKVLKRALG